jgi:AraC-like DNA-binding protein
MRNLIYRIEFIHLVFYLLGKSMQVNINLLSVVIGVGITIGLFSAVMAFSIKKENQSPNILLALFLLAVTASICGALLFETNAYRIWPFFIRLNEPFRFLIAPLFWLFVRALTTGKITKKWYLILLFLPFVVDLIFLLPFYRQAADIKIQFATDRFASLNPFEIARDDGAWFLLIIQYAIYLVVIQKEIARYARRLEENYSSVNDINLQWLRKIISGTLFLCIGIVFIIFLMAIWSGLKPSVDLPVPSIRLSPGLISIFLIFFVYKALRQPQIFVNTLAYQDQEMARKKYKKSNLTPEEARQLLQEIKQYMELEKPYREPELTLQLLSERIQIPVRRLSQVINENTGMNFLHFINNYRVQEIKEQLSNTSFQHKTILDIAFEAGFNSKATFNAAFKELTGLTPKQFRNNPASQKLN